MEAEEWKANPIVWAYFIPLNFFFSLSLSLLTFLPKCTVGMRGTLSKAYVSEAAQNRIPMMSSSYPHCLLIILQSLCLCKLEGKGRLNNPVIYNTVAAQTPQGKTSFRLFENKLAHSSRLLLLIPSHPPIPRFLPK